MLLCTLKAFPGARVRQEHVATCAQTARTGLPLFGLETQSERAFRMGPVALPACWAGAPRLLSPPRLLPQVTRQRQRRG